MTLKVTPGNLIGSPSYAWMEPFFGGSPWKKLIKIFLLSFFFCSVFPITLFCSVNPQQNVYFLLKKFLLKSLRIKLLFMVWEAFVGLVLEWSRIYFGKWSQGLESATQSGIEWLNHNGPDSHWWRPTYWSAVDMESLRLTPPSALPFSRHSWSSVGSLHLKASKGLVDC